MSTPAQPRIYHIVHVDRLASIIASGGLFCDATVVQRGAAGTTIGMNSIKHRRLTELTLRSHPGLYVGQCVPFYFCPRSIMLYLIHQANHPELSYRGGQAPIIHLEADLVEAANWANHNGRRWAFTLSNAGARYFEDRVGLEHLAEIDWEAVQARSWSQCKEGKQAEFLVEGSLPWSLIERVGVLTKRAYTQVCQAMQSTHHRPRVEVKPDWYY